MHLWFSRCFAADQNFQYGMPNIESHNTEVSCAPRIGLQELGFHQKWSSSIHRLQWHVFSVDWIRVSLQRNPSLRYEWIWRCWDLRQTWRGCCSYPGSSTLWDCRVGRWHSKRLLPSDHVLKSVHLHIEAIERAWRLLFVPYNMLVQYCCISFHRAVRVPREVSCTVAKCRFRIVFGCDRWAKWLAAWSRGT